MAMFELPPLKPLKDPAEPAKQPVQGAGPLEAAPPAGTDALTAGNTKTKVASTPVSLIPEADTHAAALQAAGVTTENHGQISDDQAMDVIGELLKNLSALRDHSPTYQEVLHLYTRWIGEGDSLSEVDKKQLRLDIYRGFYKLTQTLGKLELFDPKTRTYNQTYLPIIQQSMMEFSAFEKPVLTDADVASEPKLRTLLRVLGVKTIAELQKKVGAAVDGKFSYDTLFHAQMFALEQSARGLQERAGKELRTEVEKGKKALQTAQKLESEFKSTSSFWEQLQGDPTQVSDDGQKLLAKLDISFQNGQLMVHGQLTTPDEAMAQVKAHYEPLIQKAREEAELHFKAFDTDFAAMQDILPAEEAEELLAYRRAADDVKKEALGLPSSGDPSPLHLVRKVVVRVGLLQKPEALAAVQESVETGQPVTAEAAKDMQAMGITVEKKADGKTEVRIHGQVVDQKDVSQTLKVAHRGICGRSPGARLWKHLMLGGAAVNRMSRLIAEQRAIEALILAAPSPQAALAQGVEKEQGKPTSPSPVTAHGPAKPQRETAPLMTDSVDQPEAAEEQSVDVVPLFDPLKVTQEAADLRRDLHQRLEAHLEAKDARAKADYQEAVEAKTEKQRAADRLAQIQVFTAQSPDHGPLQVEQPLAQDGGALGPAKVTPDSHG